jgi:hypothetical protein
MNSSSQKPRVLSNYSMFTQNSGQKFTLQNLTSQINETLNFATGNLLSKKTQELNSLSCNIKGLQEEYITNRFERTEEYQSALGELLSSHEKQIETLPYHLTTKLQEYSNSKTTALTFKNVEIKEEVKQETSKPAIKPTTKLAFGPAKDDLFMDSDEEVEQNSKKKRIMGLKKKPEMKHEPSTQSSFLETQEKENQSTENLILRPAQKTKRAEGSGGQDFMVAIEPNPTVDMSSVTPLSDFLKKYTTQSGARSLPASGMKRVKKVEFKSPEANSMGFGDGDSGSRKYGPYFF